MDGPAQPSTPVLIVIDSAGNRRGSLNLPAEHMFIGRSHDSDILLDDPSVSRTHAAIIKRDDGHYVQDVGSSSGTTVNGVSVTTPCRLQTGDVLQFGSARLEYFDPSAPNRSAPARTVAMQRVEPAATKALDPRVQFDVDRQRADTISNVGGNQYNAYVRHVTHQRESFFREIAATRTKARWLIWTGLALFVVGGGIFASMVIRLMTSIGGQFPQNFRDGSADFPEFSDIFGTPVLGVPLGLWGWAMSAIGSVLMIVGIVLHIVATSRRKRVDRDYPLPRPAGN